MRYDNVRLLLFDLDGTLADTLEGISLGIRMALSECGYPPRDNDYVRRAIGNGPVMLCRRVLPDELYDDTEAAERLLAVYRRTYAETYRMTTEPYAGIRETVAKLRREGFLLAVLSNKQDELVSDMTNRLFPDGEFVRAWGTTAERRGKPDPAGALALCRELGVSPSDTVMIGDGETDYAVSVNAGMRGHILVTWGFRPRAALEAAGGVVFADTPAQIAELLG